MANPDRLTTLRIVMEDASRLADYARIPIRFEVSEMFDAEAIDQLRRGARAVAVPIHRSYVKDYDSYEGHHPTDWPKRFDITTWIFLAAYSDSTRVGGAVVVIDSQLDLSDDRGDLALLWDLRVTPEMRGRGVGAALLRAAEDAAVHRGARALRVETQQVNVAACRFYQRHGFSLERVTAAAYPSLPDEVQLLWLKALRTATELRNFSKGERI